MTDKLYEIFKNCRCIICNHQLTVSPILSIQVGQDRYTCGRCKVIETNNQNKWVRNNFFEAVAQHVPHPCSYHCGKNLTFDRVNHHEAKCRYRTLSCPLIGRNGCSGMIRVDQLRQHFTEKHCDIKISEDTVDWTLENYSDNMCLLQIESYYFFVYMLRHSRVAVLATRPIKYTKFNLKLKVEAEENFSIYFDDIPVVAYHSQYHCFMCIQRQCNMQHIHFLTGNLPFSDFTTFNKGELCNVDHFKGKLRCNITLIPDETGDPYEGENENSNGNQVDTDPTKINVEAIKTALNCPYCMTYMEPPIFACSLGHVICKACKQRQPMCPTCRSPFGTVRNFTLEEMASTVHVPCQYVNNGCDSMGKISEMRTHEQRCSFKSKITHISSTL